jgi:hypothetical protein
MKNNERLCRPQSGPSPAYAAPLRRAGFAVTGMRAAALCAAAARRPGRRFAHRHARQQPEPRAVRCEDLDTLESQLD